LGKQNGSEYAQDAVGQAVEDAEEALTGFHIVRLDLPPANARGWGPPAHK
jgi:hypothetical protein